jgi:alkylmercury lyase
MTTNGTIDLDDLAASILSVFPTLDPFEQRLSLELYRLLAEGQAVPRAKLAERLGVGVEIVNGVLGGWPGVFSDPQQRVVGYWGLSIPEAYCSPHRLTVDGRKLFAWCAWDTLFLPQLLGQRVEVESSSPTPGVTVNLTVTPEKAKHVAAAGVHMSFLLPDAAAMQKDVVTTFCHFVHFFPSHEDGERWAAQHAGTFIMPIADAYGLACRKNEAQYRDVLV